MPQTIQDIQRCITALTELLQSEQDESQCGFPMKPRSTAQSASARALISRGNYSEKYSATYIDWIPT